MRPANDNPDPRAPRKLICARCGAAFDCGLSGDCWCAAEPYRLRITDVRAQQDCLCPACLRQAALSQGAIVSLS